MRKILYLLFIGTLSISCTNQDVEFDDFKYQSVYFPFQTPLRTIMLGDEVIGDNSIDLEHAFSIGASTGGVYKNSKNIEISVEFAPELASDITDGNGNELEILPSNYYDATFNKIIIPAGSFFGQLRVNLNDGFFQDPLSTGLHYVIPLRMTEAVNVDSILSGDPIIPYPDPRVSDHWATTPKNFVLFGVKYINETHGVYLLRGKRTNTANPDDVIHYSERFIDDNDMTMLRTRSLSTSIMTTIGGTNKEEADSKYALLLSFNKDNKKVIVSQKDPSSIDVEGEGIYFTKDDPESEAYNGKKHRTIYLDYTYEDGDITYNVKDSLVFIDTDIKFEDFQVKVVNQ